jgi:hypothetical protein
MSVKHIQHSELGTIEQQELYAQPNPRKSNGEK